MSYVITHGPDGVTTNINAGIDLFLQDMVKDGQITEEQREEMMRYRVVVHEPGFWGSIWKRLYKNIGKADEWKMTTVRIVNTFDDLKKDKDDE